MVFMHANEEANQSDRLRSWLYKARLKIFSQSGEDISNNLKIDSLDLDFHNVEMKYFFSNRGKTQ